MMENLKTLLEYQQLDIKLKRLLDSLEKSDANKKREQARNEFNNAKKIMLDSEKEAEIAVANFKQSMAYFKECAEKLKEYDLIIENAEPTDDVSGIIEQLESLKSKIGALEKKLFELKSTSDKLIKSFQDANSKAIKMRKYFESAKNEYEKLINASEPEIRSIKEQLKGLRSQIDPQLMSQYKAITSDNKYPAFMEVYVGDGGEYSCRGCGLQLSHNNTSKLNENGQCVCETCRRIIYKNQ